MCNSTKTELLAEQPVYAANATETDELRAKFTRFLEVMVHRARLNYINKRKREPQTVPIHTMPESTFQVDLSFEMPSETAFNFEKESLATSYQQLSLMRQKILTLFFVYEMDAQEIADLLGCTVSHVYNQKSLALKKLRNLLGED